jgi:hypothetical protein
MELKINVEVVPFVINRSIIINEIMKNGVIKASIVKTYK